MVISANQRPILSSAVVACSAVSEMAELFAGIDAGSSFTKVVLIDDAGRMHGMAVKRSSSGFDEISSSLLNGLLREKGLSRDAIAFSVATGYGRAKVGLADATKTEIACHARGAHHCFPQTRIVVDIGGQDNKVILLKENGQVADFKMNRKCAAGTGSFLEAIARRLDMEVSELDDLAEKATKEVSIGSFCTVFAETEIIERIRAGERREDIVKGAFASVAMRVIEMCNLSGFITLTGGVPAYNKEVVRAFERKLWTEVHVPEHPQYIGALGAALFAVEASSKTRRQRM